MLSGQKVANSRKSLRCRSSFLFDILSYCAIFDCRRVDRKFYICLQLESLPPQGLGNDEFYMLRRVLQTYDPT